MEELRELHLRGATGTIRMASWNDKEHMIVPVVALIEGVIHAINADVPEFVPLSTLSAAPHTWNNRPAVLKHPTKDGRQISANSPHVLETQGLGSVFNAGIRGNKLHMEAYIDPVKAEKLGAGKMLERLRNGEIVEVSVGAYVVTEPRMGEHNGRPYKAVWKQLVPDHLAFLPDGLGACNAKMGCGTRAAEAYLVTAEGLVDITALGDKLGHPFHGNQYTDVASGNTFKIDDKVKIARHELGKYVGQEGSIYSFSESAQGKPTAYVTFEGSGLWTHIEDLEPVGEKSLSTPADDAFAHERQVARGVKHQAVTDALHTAKKWLAVEHRAIAKLTRLGHGENSFDMKVAKSEAKKRAEEVSRLEKRLKTLGDKPGHPFHGNQYVTGEEVFYSNPGHGEEHLSFSVVEDRDDRVLIESRDFPHAKIKPREVVAKSEITRRRNPLRHQAVTDALHTAKKWLAVEHGAIAKLTKLGHGESSFDMKVARYEAKKRAEEVSRLEKRLKTLEAEEEEDDDLDIDLPDNEEDIEHADADSGDGHRAAGETSCGCHKGGSVMTKELKAAAIKTLTETKGTGFEAKDAEWLAGLPDRALETMQVLNGAKIKAEESVKAAELKAAEEKKPVTVEEYLKAAPVEIRTLVDRQQKQDAARKATLLGQLKTAQAEYTEDELKAMDVEQLERLSRVAKIETADYRGRALPRAAEEKDDVFLNPPDPYAIALKAREQKVQ